MAWELAAYDTMRDYLPVVRVILDMDFERTIDAVTPDPKVADQAKEARKKVMEEFDRRAQERQ